MDEWENVRSTRCTYTNTMIEQQLSSEPAIVADQIEEGKKRGCMEMGTGWGR